MKKLLPLIIAIIVLAAVVAAAVILYPQLTSSYEDTGFTQQPITEEEAPSVSSGIASEADPSPTPAPTDNGETEATLMPDFTVYDAQGNEAHLSDFRGKIVVINFFASWCPPCKAEMPYFEEAYQAYGDDVQFMMIDMTDGYNGETLEVAKEYITKNGFTFPAYFDTEQSAAYAYGTSSIPQTFIIQPDGRLYAYQIGAVTKDALFGAIESAMEDLL